MTWDQILAVCVVAPCVVYLLSDALLGNPSDDSLEQYPHGDSPLSSQGPSVRSNGLPTVALSTLPSSAATATTRGSTAVPTSGASARSFDNLLHSTEVNRGQ